MPLPRNVKSMGVVSFLNDIASEMLYPIIPLFITGTLGASPAILGVIEGLADGLASGLKWIGGRLSDKTGKRKPYMLGGYSLSAISKPAMGLAALVTGPFAWVIFLTGRVSDRVGKAVRTAPRDALLADSVSGDQRGAAFGFHRAMDTCGAIIGPLIALLILKIFPDIPLQNLFFAALIPGAVCIFVASKFVEEVRTAPKAEKPEAGNHAYSRSFWWIVIAFAVFSLGNSSDAFLFLRAKDVGLSFTQVILAYTLYNLMNALLAWPIGHWSDRIGRKPMIVAGWLVYAAVYVAFARGNSPALVWIAMSAYGIYIALTDGVIKAMVTDVVAPGSRGSALGIIASVGGICQVCASIVTGLLWKQVFQEHYSLALVICAVCSVIAAAIILFSPAGRKTKKTASSSHSQ